MTTLGIGIFFFVLGLVLPWPWSLGLCAVLWALLVGSFVRGGLRR